MNKTFLQLFKSYIAYHENTSNPFDRRKKDTIQAYKNKYSLIQKFLFEKDMTGLMPTEFSITCARGFMRWLNESCGYSHNYCVRTVEICSAVMEEAASNEEITHNPLQPLKLKRVPPGKPIYLTETEISALHKYEAPNSMTEKAKNMFLFQCYTGFDYGDLITANKNNICTHRVRSFKDGVLEVKNMEFLIKDRKKSNPNRPPSEANIPYMLPAKEIFERHGYNMKLLSNPKYNAALKDIAIDCYIDKHLTTHVGRKTCAMLLLNNMGYSIQAVSKILGHSSVKTTETYYAQVNLELVSREQILLGL
jgi:integrase/recombinase XerD